MTSSMPWELRWKPFSLGVSGRRMATEEAADDLGVAEEARVEAGRGEVAGGHWAAAACGAVVACREGAVIPVEVVDA